MKFASLSCSSNQNCYLIETKHTAVLIDACLSSRMLCNFIESIDRSLDMVTATFITHKHFNHIKGLKQLLKMINIPVFINKLSRNQLDLNFKECYDLVPNTAVQWEDLTILPFSVNHDAVNTFGFKFLNEQRSLFFASDIGSYDQQIIEICRNSNLIAIESNYNEQMLSISLFPLYLRQCIASANGHLSN